MQEFTRAHIYVFVSKSVKFSISTKRKTHVDWERFWLGTVWLCEETCALLGCKKHRNAPIMDLGDPCLSPWSNSGRKIPGTVQTSVRGAEDHSSAVRLSFELEICLL